jgi:hypothetical protein
LPSSIQIPISEVVSSSLSSPSVIPPIENFEEELYEINENEILKTIYDSMIDNAKIPLKFKDNLQILFSMGF